MGRCDICDCYAMSQPSVFSVRNGGESKPIHFQHGEADANARLIAAAPDLLSAAELALDCCEYSHVREVLRAAIAKATT